METVLWAISVISWIGCCVICYYLGKRTAFREALKMVEEGTTNARS